MTYLLLGGAVLALYVWATSGKSPLLKRREWRVLTSALSQPPSRLPPTSACGGWGSAIVLSVVGLWLAASTRKSTMAAPPPEPCKMSADEARRILGSGPTPAVRRFRRPTRA